MSFPSGTAEYTPLPLHDVPIYDGPIYDGVFRQWLQSISSGPKLVEVR